jgi:hypothetical protein
MKGGGKMKAIFGFTALALTMTASILLMAIGLIYFIFTLWIVKFSAGLIIGKSVIETYPHFIILTAGMIAVGSMIGSAMQK